MPPILPRLLLNALANWVANPLLRQSTVSGAPAAAVAACGTVSSKNLNEIQHQVAQMRRATHSAYGDSGNADQGSHHLKITQQAVSISQSTETGQLAMPIPKTVAPSLFHLPEQTQVAVRRQSWHDDHEPIFVDVEEVQCLGFQLSR